MQFVVYILESETSGRYYIGQTSDLEKRLQQHREGLTVSTRNKGPWKLLHTQTFATRYEAMVLEKKLKYWKSHQRFADKLIADKD